MKKLTPKYKRKKITAKDLRLYEKGFEDGYATAKRLYKK